MATAGFARVVTEEYERAPEFRYLVSWVRREAEAALGELADLPADAPARDAPDGPVLVVDGRTLLTRRSLARMAEAVAASGRPAAPVALERTSLAADHPVYTLRGFERLEEGFLAGPAPAPGGSPPWPALLLPAAAVAGLPPGTPLGRCLHEPFGGPGGPAVAEAGLCHRFADYYGQAREDVVELLAAEGAAGAGGGAAPRVLEVGCGRGATGRLLEERLGCLVTGVELNPVVALAAARHLHRVVAGDFLEVADGLAAEGPFDVLVALELFEHLTDQDAFLELARRLLRPGGRIVLSVPNVGHYSVVEDLLAGRWDYLPIGLLCHTHYRFFTRHTLEDWLGRCGFRIFRLVPQETELPERWRRPAALPDGLEVDAESLRTKGFYVVATAG